MVTADSGRVRREAVRELNNWLDDHDGEVSDGLLALLLSPESAAGNLIRAEVLREAADAVCGEFAHDDDSVCPARALDRWRKQFNGGAA
jgi:hypothetical protein